jgi:hypothetical protein
MSSKLRSCPGDLLCIASELVTGKSIPVLMGIVQLPVDRGLVWLVLSLGAITGVLFSVYSSRVVAGMTALGFANRFVQLCFSLFLSMSLMLSIARGIHFERGLILSLIPAFCVVTQPLPQHQLTSVVVFVLSCAVLSRCLSAPVGPPPPTAPQIGEANSVSVLPALNAQSAVEDESATVWGIVLRALQLFVLAFYASVQHAPTQEYFGLEQARKEHHSHHHHQHRKGAVYASPHHSMHARYACLVGLVSAWLRVSFWYTLCFFQDNIMHIMLENDHSRGGWDWSCCIVYITALLYSGCWTATQIREQVLPHLRIDLLRGGGPLKLIALMLGLAALYRQRDGGAIFMATNALTLAVLATTALTLK